MSRPSRSSAGGVAVAYVTAGTYQRDLIQAEAQAFTQGTEFEISDVSDAIVAATANKDELFSWVRGKVFKFITDGYDCYEWMVLRQNSADALPDLNDNAAVEILQKEKRIYTRGFELVPDPDSGGPVKPIKFELFNVKLRYGEEIRLVIRPLVTTAATGRYYGLIEWRQVGV